MAWDQRNWLEDSKTFPKVQEHEKILKIEQVMPCGSWEIFGYFEKSTLIQMT